MPEIKDNTTYQLTDKISSKLNKPTFGRLDDLREMGFDIHDIDSINAAWFNMQGDAVKTENLVDLLFESATDSTHADYTIKDLNLQEVRRGLLDFFAEYGLYLQLR